MGVVDGGSLYLHRRPAIEFWDARPPLRDPRVDWSMIGLGVGLVEIRCPCRWCWSPLRTIPIPYPFGVEQLPPCWLCWSTESCSQGSFGSCSASGVAASLAVDCRPPIASSNAGTAGRIVVPMPYPINLRRPATWSHSISMSFWNSENQTKEKNVLLFIWKVVLDFWILPAFWRPTWWSWCRSLALSGLSI